MPLHDRFPVGSEILANINQFVRGNPFISTAILLTTLTGITAGVVTVRKKRKSSIRRKRSTKKRKGRKLSRRKGVVKRKKRITHRSPRHKGHKRVSFTTADGKRVNFLVKKPAHVHRRKRRR